MFRFSPDTHLLLARSTRLSQGITLGDIYVHIYSKREAEQVFNNTLYIFVLFEYVFPSFLPFLLYSFYRILVKKQTIKTLQSLSLTLSYYCFKIFQLLPEETYGTKDFALLCDERIL